MARNGRHHRRRGPSEASRPRPTHLRLVDPTLGADEPIEAWAEAAEPSSAPVVEPTEVAAVEVGEPEPWSVDQVLVELVRFRESSDGRWLAPEAFAVLRVLLTHGIVELDGRWSASELADATSGEALQALDATGALTAKELAALPEALRAWTRYFHQHVTGGDPRGLVQDLGLLDEWSADWQERVDRLGTERSWWPHHLHRQLSGLAAAVGGEEVLLVLDTTPLPDEPVRTEGSSPDVARLLQAAAERCDQYLHPEALAELRVVCRRLLERAARRSPSLLLQRRTGALAAATVYAAVHGNRLKVGRPSLFQTSRIATAMGVSASSVPGWARELLGAIGVTGASAHPAGSGHPSGGSAGRRPLHLGDPDLLISNCRGWILDDADWLRTRIAELTHSA